MKTIIACFKQYDRISYKLFDPALRTMMRRGSTIMRVMDYYNVYNTSTGAAENYIKSVNEGTTIIVPVMTFPARQISIENAIVVQYAQGWDTNFIPTTPEYGDNYSPWTSITYDPASHYRITANLLNGMFNSVNETISRYAAEVIPNEVDLEDLANDLRDFINPSTTLLKIANAKAKIVNPTEPTPPPLFTDLTTVRTAPVFDMPMIDPLTNFYNEFICPNLKDFEMNTMTLLEVNYEFMESYMVGLNHEMNRQLLWDGYPTDQRTTFFKTFFHSDTPPLQKIEMINIDPTRATSVNQARDIKSIDKWEDDSLLGAEAHSPRLRNGVNTVLVIRAELINKFKNLNIYAQKATWESGKRAFDSTEPVKPLFFSSVDPDIYLLGFSLEIEELNGSSDPNDNNPGYFIVLQERAGDTRFGFGMPANIPSDDADYWEEIDWWHIAQEMGYSDINSIEYISPNLDISPGEKDDDDTGTDLSWGTNAADMAFIFYDKPVKVGIHASTMIHESLV